MSQLIKVGNFLMEIDGARVSFFDASGNPVGQPQSADHVTPITMPDGQTIAFEDLAEYLSGDDLVSFETAAGGQNQQLPEIPEDSGSGRFARFEDQDAIRGLTAIGGLLQTDGPDGLDTPSFAAKTGFPQPLSELTLFEPALPTAPTADDGALATAEDHGIGGRVTGHDPNGGALTYILVTPPAHGDLVFHADGTFTYTPHADYHGTDSFTYKVNDGNEDSNVALVGITVNPVNDLPLADDNSLTLAEDSSAASSVHASDVDGDALTYAVVTGPQHGTLTFHDDGTFTYTPDAEYHGADSFTYKVNDGTADSNVATVQINVQPVNDVPVAENGTLTLAEDHSANSQVHASDVDGDNVGYVLVNGPQHGNLVFHVDGSFSYTPNANYNGPDSFTYKADDGQADSNVASVDITVNPVNDVPLADGNSLTLAEDSSVASSVQASDIDGDALSYSVVTGPQHGSLTFHADGTFTYTPNANYNGPDSFTYKANDGTADSNVASVQINVQPVNDASVAENGTLTLAEDHSVNSQVHASDVDGDNVGYVLVNGPQHGTIAFHADGTFTYTPNANYNGPDSFTYKANDGTADSNVASVGITVNPVNDLPVADNGTLTLAEDRSAQSAVIAHDVDGDTVSYTLVNGPQHGSIAFHADGTFTYTPNANYNGPDNFTYKASDGTGFSNTASVGINVTPVNDAPVVAAYDSHSEAHITRVTVDQNPFGDNKVGDYLAGGGADSKAVNPSMINGVNSSNLTLAQAADVKVSFVSEGAGYRSMVGTYTFDASGKIDPASVKFLWLDASQTKQNTAGGALEKDFLGNSQPQDVSLGNLAANTRMGFFIIADGASQSGNVSALKAISGVDVKGNDYTKDISAINSHLSFAKDANGNGQILLDGKSLSGNVYFTHDKTLNTDNVNNDIEHTLSGITTKPDGKLYVGFEDLAGGGDKDYDDVIFNVDIGSYNINKLSLTTTQPTVELSDIDSTHLKSAVIATSGFQSGDLLNMPSNALFDVKAEAHGSDMTYTVTAKSGLASVAAFEDFLNHAFFSTANATEGHRTISYQVTDAEGDRSNVSVADVHVTTSYEISVSELKNLTQLGSGDDTLHFNQAMTKAVDFGAGHDSVHFAQSNMDFGSADAKMLKNVETIDAQGAGANKVAISFGDVLDMTDGDHHLTILGEKGDSITLSGDGTHHWTVTGHDADFTTYSFNDGVHQAVVDVSNQMVQTVS